jgi:hypothetical protein
MLKMIEATIDDLNRIEKLYKDSLMTPDAKHAEGQPTSSAVDKIK